MGSDISNFTFAFNNIDFSDRILKIDILPDLFEGARNLKRRRGDVSCETSDETTESNDSSSKTLHISRPILAAKSPFFYKLFSNGMKESKKSNVTLRIQASEEAALMELLNFMYTDTLTTKAPSALIDILKAADKYEVVSCMSYCTKLLLDLPMTCELALLYLDLPSTIPTFAPFINTANQFLVDRFKDLTKYKQELLKLPIAGIEVVLSSDDLQVSSEDDVYDFVSNWVRLNYPNMKERQNIMNTHLNNLIRFPYMTVRKLESVLKVKNLNLTTHRCISSALSFKAENLHQQRLIAAEAITTHRQFVERSYSFKPIKVVEFESPFPQSIVYFDIKKEECANLYPSSEVISQVFHLGANKFTVDACCSTNQQSNSHSFGLYLTRDEKQVESLVVAYEFAARKNKKTKKFEEVCNGVHDVKSSFGFSNLFDISWDDFIADDSIYFINGVLHLRAELTIMQ